MISIRLQKNRTEPNQIESNQHRTLLFLAANTFLILPVILSRPHESASGYRKHHSSRKNGCCLSTIPFSPVQSLLHPPAPLLLPQNPTSLPHRNSNFPAISSPPLPRCRRPSPEVLLYPHLRSSPLRRSCRENETGNC